MNFLQVIVNSLPQMAIYSLATIGIVLIFRTTGTTNFAQGLIATFGTFMTTQMALYAGLPLWLGLIIDDSADERQHADLLRFIAICNWGVEKGIISQSVADSYMISAYAMSSFIALDVFMTGINRLADKEITRENLLEAMESAPIDVPISGGVNYANGQRIGLDGMSFVKYVRPSDPNAAASTGTFVNVINMQSIDEILGELSE